MFDESRYALRKAHFRPNSKSQQGLLLHTLFFLHRHHALSLSNSFSLSLSLNFLLSLIPFINWSLLAPFPFPENISSSY
ncbi:hypothetical protein glysoja_050173 [Glycine soja]|uniref:Uncharacterized protein n=1 Tax=Glycine soja TaxID=3848 RepID=A0A0B2STR3_GLYSO|nr:hypothetical protein glysoja_050173 [Glycine soja]